MSIRILHISDFHFEANVSFDEDTVKSAILKMIKHSISKDIGPDLIVVTGDIAKSGKDTEYETATKFFDQLLEVARLDRQKLFVIPGNHDIERPNNSGLQRTLKDQSESDKYFDSGSVCPHIMLCQRAFSKWYDNYFQRIRSFPSNKAVCLEESTNIDGQSIVIVGLNTAIFSRDDNDNGSLWVGRRSFSDVNNPNYTNESSIRVLLMHHPISWLHQGERQIVETKIRENFDLLLHGHLHEEDYTLSDGPGGTIRTFAAGACYQSGHWPKKCHWLEVEENSVRVLPLEYNEGPSPNWSRDSSLFPESDDDYCQTFPLKGVLELPKQVSSNRISGNDTAIKDGTENLSSKSLLFAPNGKPLFVEPRIFDKPHSECDGPEDAKSVSIDELMLSDSSIAIEAPSEFGGTVLSEYIEHKFSRLSNVNVVRENAETIPNYNRKIQSHYESISKSSDARKVLIVDNYRSSRDGRLVRELISSSLFTKIIIIVSDGDMRDKFVVAHDDTSTEFSYCYLWALSRRCIRNLAEQIFDNGDVDFISTAVEKVYSDLLGLCIPLTPANVIMYLHILHKEEDFYPINRVDILDRYVKEILTKPSDAFVGSFNAKNKVDVLSSFIIMLFENGAVDFNLSDWVQFCDKYKKERLIGFDERKLIDDILSARIFLKVGSSYVLKYRFYYVYFVGKAVVSRPKLQKDLMNLDSLDSLDNLVDVITGLSLDNAKIIAFLVDQLKSLIEEFKDKYIRRNFDPLQHAKWPEIDNEAKSIWEPIREEIEKGPSDSTELDALKESLSSEALTHDQKVKLDRFHDLEFRVFRTVTLLEDGLRNSDDILGALKVQATRLIYQCHLIVLQLGTLLSKQISEKRIVSWGGIRFRDFDTIESQEGDVVQNINLMIVPYIDRSVSYHVADNIGTKKLGEVFKAISSIPEKSEFEEFVNFGCLLAAKPEAWSDRLKAVIESFDRSEYRLLSILGILMNDYKHGLNNQQQRDEIKSLIALIETKRSLKTNKPGNKAVKKVLGKMEESNVFDDKSEIELDQQ